VELVAFFDDPALDISTSDYYSDSIHVWDLAETVTTVAAFSNVPDHVCQSNNGLPCTFTFINDSEHADEGYLWDFGNGQTSTDENPPPIVFDGDPNEQVDYTITWIAYGVFNIDTLQTKLHVIPDGTTAAVFHVNPSECIAPCEVQIEHYSIGDVAWDWDHWQWSDLE
jgi:hypothetical protein